MAALFQSAVTLRACLDQNRRPKSFTLRAPFQDDFGSVSSARGQRASVRVGGRRQPQALRQESIAETSTAEEYIPGPLDDILLNLFRTRMAEEVGWDSSKPGYEGLIEIVRRRYKRSPSNEATELSTATCQWLMGPCTLNEVTLEDGSTLMSGVLVHKCKFLQESKCAGICTHVCKMPTQRFIKQEMDIPLAMEPNFTDFSCQFKYGVAALPREEDPGLQTPCLTICPIAAARSTLRNNVQTQQCPQV